VVVLSGLVQANRKSMTTTIYLEPFYSEYKIGMCVTNRSTLRDFPNYIGLWRDMVLYPVLWCIHYTWQESIAGTSDCCCGGTTSSNRILFGCIFPFY